VLKHYYLQGLHQVVVNADVYINGDVWKKLTPGQQKAMEVAADASLIRSLSYRIYENGKALKDLTENHGVILHDTPPDYFTESQKAFADIAVPFWSGAQMSNAKLGMAHAESLKK
jgi:TRAP-type mannitol/chloroaromatic compound transport system substrate-binding protein